MADVTYVIVEHDGGWAYKLGDVFSETFRTHQDAHDAAEIAAAEQRRAGDNEAIEYQDKDGRWKVEDARGDDRPVTHLEDPPFPMGWKTRRFPWDARPVERHGTHVPLSAMGRTSRSA